MVSSVTASPAVAASELDGIHDIGVVATDEDRHARGGVRTGRDGVASSPRRKVFGSPCPELRPGLRPPAPRWMPTAAVGVPPR
jgi:hypothetical protein